MKNYLIVCIYLISFSGTAQTATDLFNPSEHTINWLGVDFSNVKLIGQFSQFEDAGDKGVVEIKEKYFPGWNQLVLNEPSKFDIEGMLRKEGIRTEIDMVTLLNSITPTEYLEDDNTPNYSKEKIQEFVQKYDTKGLTGIGIAFVAEDLNKRKAEAHFHFVAINLSSKQLLIHERITGTPSGIGIRNYWGGSIYSVVKQIKATYYKKWKKLYQ